MEGKEIEFGFGGLDSSRGASRKSSSGMTLLITRVLLALGGTNDKLDKSDNSTSSVLGLFAVR